MLAMSGKKLEQPYQVGDVPANPQSSKTARLDKDQISWRVFLASIAINLKGPGSEI